MAALFFWMPPAVVTFARAERWVNRLRQPRVDTVKGAVSVSALQGRDCLLGKEYSPPFSARLSSLSLAQGCSQISACEPGADELPAWLGGEPDQRLAAAAASADGVCERQQWSQREGVANRSNRGRAAAGGERTMRPQTAARGGGRTSPAPTASQGSRTVLMETTTTCNASLTTAAGGHPTTFENDCSASATAPARRVPDDCKDSEVLAGAGVRGPARCRKLTAWCSHSSGSMQAATNYD